MCKHVPNAQVQIYSRCCKKWWDCAQCHKEQQPDHEIEKDDEMVFGCKQCRHVFRVDISDDFNPDEQGYCPKCDNKWYIKIEGGDDEQQLLEFQMDLEKKGLDAADIIRDARDHIKEKRREELLKERIYKGEDITMFGVYDNEDLDV